MKLKIKKISTKVKKFKNVCIKFDQNHPSASYENSTQKSSVTSNQNVQ